MPRQCFNFFFNFNLNWKFNFSILIFSCILFFLNQTQKYKRFGFKLELSKSQIISISFPLSLILWAIPWLPWATTGGDFSPNLYPHDLTLSNLLILTNWQSLYGWTLSFSSYWIGQASLSVSFFASLLRSPEVWSGFVFPSGCCLF